MKGPWFFIGVGGSGMSAIAQFLSFRGEEVAGSDRDFARDPNSAVRRGLLKTGVHCFPQDGSGLTSTFATVVRSTAIEEDHPELQKARELGCLVVHRSELLAHLCSSMRTIAVAGTSGKSTTTAILFHILQRAGWKPSLMTGAGLTELENQGWIGNAWGYPPKQEDTEPGWLVIEADESDGSVVRYHPEIGLLLNIDRDHKELDELRELFAAFCAQSEKLCVNRDNAEALLFSRDAACDFSIDRNDSGTHPSQFVPLPDGGWQLQIDSCSGKISLPGRHNLSNTLAAIAAARTAGVPLSTTLQTLHDFKGIWRRYQRIGTHLGISLVDDFAHNPTKIAAAIATAQAESSRVLAWFQPHGFSPARFMQSELAQILSQQLRPQDQIWFSEIHFAGGTVRRDISGANLAQTARAAGCNAHFIANRTTAAAEMVSQALTGDLILLMGARDPSLDSFAQEVYHLLQKS